MKVRRLFNKNILIILSLLTIPMTSVYAEADLNELLNGTYAQNEQWACNNSFSPFQIACPDCWTNQTTAAGKITYNGDGTAHGEGRYSSTNTTTPDGDIGTYSCDWNYTVNSDRSFFYEGQCTVESLFSGEPAAILTNQKWYGHIGKGKGKGKIVVDRHDGEIEGISVDGGVSNVIDSVCGKTGIQIKLKKQDS
jgi:hypothetical protein